MKTVEVVSVDGGQIIRLPDEYHFDEKRVSIRREGDTVILQPLRMSEWPAGFFDAIRIDDPCFARP